MDIHGSIIGNSLKVETTSKSINWYSKKQNVVCSYGRLYEKELISCYNKDELENIVWWKKPDAISHMLYDFI
jgi:hypothetical protein